MKTLKYLARIVPLLLLASCASWDRGCSGCVAENFGADWVVITNGTDGHIVNCWRLKETSVTNEPASDGIWWKDSVTGHLIHISGWYSRVQVEGGNFDTAAHQLGVDLTRCPGGRYLDEETDE